MVNNGRILLRSTIVWSVCLPDLVLLDSFLFGHIKTDIKLLNDESIYHEVMNGLRNWKNDHLGLAGRDINL